MAEWNENDVRRILLNPVHTMGPKPTVPDQQWITAQTKLLGEMGKREYFAELLRVMKETFGPFVSGPDEESPRT